MILSQSPVLSGARSRIPEGRRGIMTTLTAMRLIVTEERCAPAINAAAINLTMLAGRKDRLTELDRIFGFVRDQIRYVPDVLDVETLIAPTHLLRRRAGDCDDMVMLLAALCETIGFRTRFCCVGYRDADTLEHVYVQAELDGEWIAMDATEDVPLGWEPPLPLAKWVENIGDSP